MWRRKYHGEKNAAWQRLMHEMAASMMKKTGVMQYRPGEINRSGGNR
jgi:hypothetical protein